MIETPDGNLPPGMRQLNGVYTQRFNRRDGRVGHVLQGRYKANHVERERYLLELCRYVVLHPVRAEIVQVPNDYPWSSYRATVGADPAPAWLTTDWVLAQFGHQQRQAQARYQAFVLKGVGHLGPWEQVHRQLLLGHAAFITCLQPALKQRRAIPEIPKAQ